MSLSIQFTPEVADHGRAAAAGLLARKVVLWLGLGVFVVVPWACALVLVVLTLAYDVSLDISNLVVMTCTPPLAVAAFAFLVWLQAKRAQATGPTVQGPHLYEFGPEGIKISAPGLSNNIAWDTVTTSTSTRFGELLFSGHCPILFIPARAFSSEMERAEFRAIVNVHLGKLEKT